MSETSELIRLLKELSKVPLLTIVAEVTKVDEDEFTIDAKPLDGTPELFDIRLKSGIDSSNEGLIVVPEKGSHVLVTLINNDPNKAFVSGTNKVASIQLRGDEFGGLVKVKELADVVKEIKDDLNSLKQVFTTWVPVASTPGDGGASLKAAAATWYAQLLAPTSESQLKNDNVTHG